MVGVWRLRALPAAASSCSRYWSVSRLPEPSVFDGYNDPIIPTVWGDEPNPVIGVLLGPHEQVYLDTVVPVVVPCQP